MRVLILGGGGTLGAFSAGAMKYIEGAKAFDPDVVLCSSAGGINYLRSTVGESHESVKFWQSLRGWTLVGDALRDNPFNGGVLNEKKFYERVERDVDFEAMLQSPKQVGFLVVDMVHGTVDVRGNRTERDAESLRIVSRGAYALPPLLPPVPLRDALLCDGGFLHNAPLEAALEMGASEIVYLCNVGVVPSQWRSSAWTAPASRRYAEIFFRRASNVGFAGAKITEGRFHGVPFVTIAAPSSGGVSTLIGSMLPTQNRIARLIESGYVTAREAFTGYNAARSAPADAAARTMGASAEVPEAV